MAIDLTKAPAANLTTDQAPIVVDEQLFCSLTGEPLRAGDAYWAPPLVTARELMAAVITTLVRTPGNLGHVLFAEQPNVPYAPHARERLAARRTAEQLKLLAGLLLAVALIVIPIVLLAMG